MTIATTDHATLDDPSQLGWKAWLRAQVRRSEFYLTLLAALIGATTGVIVVGISRLTRYAHAVLFGAMPATGLSGTGSLPALSLLAPIVGGLLVGLSIVALRRWHSRPIVDPIEANALHGGRMSLTDSLIVAAQTALSNGVGASVGLEAAYTQMGGVLGSRIGIAFRLRRQDMRTLVGCGTAAAIAAAFDAPITGAFYAFELIIGSYAVATMAPVMAACISAVLVARALGGVSVALSIETLPQIELVHYLYFISLGLMCGLIGIVVMRAVSLVEAIVRKSPVPLVLRPALGGLVLAGLATLTPQVLSAGHGALHQILHSQASVMALATLFVLKSVASAICLGTGFRGGLFFASLFLGAILGKLLVGIWLLAFATAPIDQTTMALVAMSALAVAIVGGPLTMTFLVLETTGNLGITGVALAACLVASMTVRELFGYSFSTWRLHLRGETIRSAHDVGWVRSLTVGKMMRPVARTVRRDMNIVEFRQQFPLGSATRVVVIDEAGRYAGIVLVAEAHAPEQTEESKERGLAALLVFKDAVLTPAMNVQQAITLFERTESEALAVVDDPRRGRVLGMLTEAHALRRYAEELDAARRGAIGEPQTGA